MSQINYGLNLIEDYSSLPSNRTADQFVKLKTHLNFLKSGDINKCLMTFDWMSI